jgi:(R,R)-butanediol dehydrogenase/meso-butanediol dehydrogenase/diacetyl reductase
MVHKLPPEIPLDYAAIIEPLAIVWHAIKVSKVTDWPKQSILVLGGGPIGFALLLCLRAIGATNVIVSEPTETRRRQVADFASKIVNPVTDDVEKVCKEASNDQGVDVVFDCAGVQVALDAGFKAIAYEGLYVMVAVWEAPMAVPNFEFLMKHITLKGTFVIGDGKHTRTKLKTRAKTTDR